MSATPTSAPSAAALPGEPLPGSAPAEESGHKHRLSSDARKQQLIDHAVELFSKRGFNGTRTKEIATACGVSEGIVFRHFATKEDLYRAILESHADEAGSHEWMQDLKRLAAAKKDRDLVRSLVTQIVRSFRENAAFHRLMLYAWLEGHELADLAHQQMGMPMFDFLRRYVAQRQKDGVFGAGDPGAIVVALYAPALQYALHKYVFRMQGTPDDDEVVTAEFVRMALAGLRAGRKK